jgi:hypothetical protein
MGRWREKEQIKKGQRSKRYLLMNGSSDFLKTIGAMIGGVKSGTICQQRLKN